MADADADDPALDAEADAFEPSAQGILECLRMLREEADTLRLDRTTRALRAAIEACILERVGRVPEGIDLAVLRRPRGARVH